MPASGLTGCASKPARSCAGRGLLSRIEKSRMPTKPIVMQAGSPECAAYFRKVHDSDKAPLAEAKGHLGAVLQGKMGRG